MEFFLPPQEKLKYFYRYKRLLQFEYYLRLIYSYHLLEQRRDLDGSTSNGFDIDEDILELLGFDLSRLIMNDQVNSADIGYYSLITGFYGINKVGKTIRINRGKSFPKNAKLKGATFSKSHILLLRYRIQKAFDNILIYIEPFLELKGVPQLHKNRAATDCHFTTEEEILEIINLLERRFKTYQENIDLAIRSAKREINLDELDTDDCKPPNVTTNEHLPNETGEVKKPLDPDAYTSAKLLIKDNFEIIPNIRALHKLLKDQPDIRRWKPSQQRLCIHLGDWKKYIEKIESNSKDEDG
ncbi:MAG: hypothetical protein ABIK28_11550, partial [Planctomycetota bacterium]